VGSVLFTIRIQNIKLGGALYGKGKV